MDENTTQPLPTQQDPQATVVIAPAVDPTLTPTAPLEPTEGGENAPAETPAPEAAPEAPAEEKKIEDEAVLTAEEGQVNLPSPDVEVLPFYPVAEGQHHNQLDPSFNCENCKGDGLLPNGTVCTTCAGTGKV